MLHRGALNATIEFFWTNQRLLLLLHGGCWAIPYSCESMRRCFRYTTVRNIWFHGHFWRANSLCVPECDSSKGAMGFGRLDDQIFLVGVGWGGGNVYLHQTTNSFKRNRPTLLNSARHCGVHWWHHVQSCHSRVLLTQTVTRAITYLQQQLQGRFFF